MANGCLNDNNIGIVLSAEGNFMTTELKEIKEDVKSILVLLNGNGRIGVCAKVNILWGFSALVVTASIVALVRSFWSG